MEKLKIGQKITIRRKQYDEKKHRTTVTGSFDGTISSITSRGVCVIDGPGSVGEWFANEQVYTNA
jgi:hypothetical protein